MALSTYTLDEIEQLVVGFFRVQFGARDLGTESWLGMQASSIALTLYLMQASVQDAYNDAIPSTLTSSTRLDEFAILFGLSNSAGGLGRRGATPATGGAGTITYNGAGPFPYTLAADAAFVASDGVTLLATAADVTWGAAGNETGTFNATTKGAAGNLAANSVITFVSPPAGFTGSVTLSVGLSGGKDQESDSELLARILSRLQDPPKAVTAHDLRTFAEVGDATYPVTSVDRAYVFPRHSGTGTADIVITQAGQGLTRGLADTTASQNAVNNNRIVTAESLTVHQPYMAATGMTISARVTPTNTTYSFDWNSHGTALTVAGYTVVGSTVHLVLSGAAPADFINAANVTHSNPRLQLNPTGSPTAIPEQPVCTSYNAGTFTCTLSAPMTTAPTNGDAVKAGGPAVQAVATAIVTYVDSLGPSKVSGLYDALDVPWDDTARIDQLTRAILDATDTDGVTHPVLATIGGPQINGGSSDKQAADNLAGVAPELLWVQAISVVP